MGQTVTVVDTPRDEVELWRGFIDAYHPMRGRLVVTKPKVQEIQESRTIIIPDTAKRVDKEFGLECQVLKTHPDIDIPVSVGDTIIIPEFAGTPIVLGVEVPFWSLGEGDIMAVITDA